MRKIKILFLILYVLIFKNSVKCGEVYLLNIEGAIGPMTYYQVKNAISLAKKNKFDFILITIDTPGGLLSSTRKIVQEILSSDIPIVGFVYP
ncbi:MAG: nodulation protein NfeD, partial [Candidatus Omnitrophica bacterium]|nr:nodulation protein NfeD [Candidatus Omnitrophota bacterium]